MVGEDAGYYDELEEIQRRKLMELQRRIEEERRRRALEEAEAQKRRILRRILTPKARERLANVRLVKPEIARLVEEQLIILAQQGRIPLPVTDYVLKAILMEISSRVTREFRFKIKEK